MEYLSAILLALLLLLVPSLARAADPPRIVAISESAPQVDPGGLLAIHVSVKGSGLAEVVLRAPEGWTLEASGGSCCGTLDTIPEGLRWTGTVEADRSVTFWGAFRAPSDAPIERVLFEACLDGVCEGLRVQVGKAPIDRLDWRKVKLFPRIYI